MVALLNARKRRMDDEREWEWTHTRVLVKAFGGVDLPSLRKGRRRKPTAAELERGLAGLAAQGIRIKEVPRK